MNNYPYDYTRPNHHISLIIIAVIFMITAIVVVVVTLFIFYAIGNDINDVGDDIYEFWHSGHKR